MTSDHSMADLSTIERFSYKDVSYSYGDENNQIVAPHSKLGALLQYCHEYDDS